MPRGKRRVITSGEPTLQTLENTQVDLVGSDTSVVTKLKTKEQTERKSPPIQEKSKELEKNSAPVLIISWNDTNGRRQTKTYTCAEIRITEDKCETLQRSGKKTTLNISLEAQVLQADI